VELDGMSFRRAPHLGYRSGNPETDVDRHGDPVKSNYVVIVRIKDCEITEMDDGRKFYASVGVSAHVSLVYGGTYYGYGPLRRRGKDYTCTVYAVNDGMVYTSTLRYREAEIRESWSLNRDKLDLLVRELSETQVKLLHRVKDSSIHMEFLRQSCSRTAGVLFNKKYIEVADPFKEDVTVTSVGQEILDYLTKDVYDESYPEESV
jgi:hypothetical protein